MSNMVFAGSRGVMDVPVPDWIKAEESLFKTWGVCMMTLMKHSQIETLNRGDYLDLNTYRGGLVIDGGLYALGQAGHDENRKMFVHFFQRGELFASQAAESLHVDLMAHCRTSFLAVPKDAFHDFLNEFPHSERIVSTLELRMTQHFAQALQRTNGKDIDRIHRVLEMLADHPTATDTKLGKEIEASKQQICLLAGVQKRSASRAFKALEEAGHVNFYGYKRLFYRGNP